MNFYSLLFSAAYPSIAPVNKSLSKQVAATLSATLDDFFLDNGDINVYTYGQMKPTYSTAEVAKAIEVSKKTLLRWLYSGSLSEPKRETFGGVESRVWSAADLERAKAFRERRYRRRS